MDYKSICLSILFITAGIVLTTTLFITQSQNEELTNKDSNLQIAFDNAKLKDELMMEEIKNSESCEIMKHKLQKYDNYFYDMNKRFYMFDSYEKRCLI